MSNHKLKDDVISALKDRINTNNKEINETDSRHREANQLDAQTIELINNLDRQLSNMTAKAEALNQKSENPGSILSTTQFFNPSLALNEYNMNGNSLATNSYMAVRQMIGIINNRTPGVLQTIPGVNGGSNSNGTNPNGSAVGLSSKNGGLAGW